MEHGTTKNFSKSKFSRATVALLSTKIFEDFKGRFYTKNSIRIPNPVSDLSGGVPKYVFFEGEHVDISI